MKTLLIAFLTFGLALAAQAQATNDWFSLDAGGGTSTSAVYAVRSTIGQPDAAKWTSANYTIIGGFWAVASTLAPDSPPALRITLAGTNVLVSWPSPSTGFGLEQNPSVVNPGGWAPVGGVPSDDGTTKSMLLPVSSAPRFLRLKK